MEHHNKGLEEDLVLDSLEAEMDIVVNDAAKTERPGKISGILGAGDEELLDEIEKEVTTRTKK
jgi:hypothetical protein